MPGPLEGVRVVELGFWVAGPATAGILADWGAAVIKIEPPDGDPFRGMFRSVAGVDISINPPFELDNRGKRSIALDVLSEQGGEIARRLIGAADVFVSNLRGSSLARAGLDFEHVHALNPRLVYCAVSGYGAAGPDRDRPSYDMGAFWSRAGVGASLTAGSGPPPQQRGGMGDHITAITAVSAICAALVARQRTGSGQRVDVSLLRTGLYILGWDLNIRLRVGKVDAPYSRFSVPNPLINCYRSGDGRWFWLLGLQADRHWPDIVRAIGRPELRDDERFKDIRARRTHNAACVELLDAIFATQKMAYWESVFDQEGVWWAPVQTISEAAGDPQVRAAGGLIEAPVADGMAEAVATPGDFSGTPWACTTMAPELGQHTEEILLELGYDWEAIARLRQDGVIA